MGRDKALVEVGGRALARIAADALTDAGAEEVFVVGGDRPALEALGLRVVPDGWPAEGPLGGIVTALEHAALDVVVVLACDLPWITAPPLRELVAALAGHDAALPVMAGRDQPLIAAWHRPTALGLLREGFRSGERSISRASTALGVARVTFSDARWARDADTPDGLFPGPTEG